MPLHLALSSRLRWLRHRLPHFLVLGTQKGGTTSLQKLLEHHPNVYLPPCKEVHYFSLHAEQPTSWYAAHFNNARWGQKRGDITPFYLFHPEAPRRIHTLLPRVRMIVLLRNPVDRSLSQIFHARRHGFETMDVADAIAAEADRMASGNAYSFQKHSYVARSRYLEQLDRYEYFFPKQQFLILKSEDLFTKTETIWHRIQTFLRIKAIPLPTALPHANAGDREAEDVDPSIRTNLESKLKTTQIGIKERYGISWE